LVQRIGHLARALLADALAFLVCQRGNGSLDVVELTEELQRLLADLAAVVDPQLVEL
jgi:hypothetical protein